MLLQSLTPASTTRLLLLKWTGAIAKGSVGPNWTHTCTPLELPRTLCVFEKSCEHFLLYRTTPTNPTIYRPPRPPTHAYSNCLQRAVHRRQSPRTRTRFFASGAKARHDRSDRLARWAARLRAAKLRAATRRGAATHLLAAARRREATTRRAATCRAARRRKLSRRR